MEPPNPISPPVEQPRIIPWEEQLQDHKLKIDEYLRNLVFRGCTVETTIRSSRAVLKHLFERLQIEDPNHPRGRRQILVWELLEPERGPSRLGLLISLLLQDNLAHGTRRKYLRELRSFCDYVLAKPNIPGNSELTIVDKYGPITQILTKYDVPMHAQDRPTKRRYALSPTLRDDFYEFMRTDYLPNHALPHVGAQDYMATVLQAEIGARTSELLAIRSSGESCDIDWETGRVRLFGKGKAFSGKRVRTVPLTPLAMEVLRVFEKVFKPMFPRGPASEYLFLNPYRGRLSVRQFYRNFKKIVELARDAGVPLPEDLRPHDLRRTFATNELERNPLAYRKVLRKLGHTYPSAAAPYLIATDADVEDEQGDLIDIFVGPYVEKRGTK
jgi:integrase